jgi:hypothetical protein
MRYRIHTEYPVYVNGGCIPYTIFFVQKLEEGVFFDRWINIKGFEDRKKAEQLLKLLQ